MKQGTCLADEVEVTVSGAFTTHHQLRTVTGTLGEMTLLAFKRKGSFQAVDGRELTVERTSWWRLVSGPGRGIWSTKRGRWCWRFGQGAPSAAARC